VKKIVFSIALCVALTLAVGSAMAQDLSIHATGTPGTHVANPSLHQPKAPKYCNPCLYYGGDWPDTDSNWVAWANADGGGFGGPVFLYSGIKVPKGKVWTVTGLFSNNVFVGIDHFTPATPEWSIYKGMANGVAGTVVASGETKGKAAVTGRSFSGDLEYTVSVKLPKKVVLKAGTYTEGVTPPCDTTQDSSCSSALFYETDSYDPSNTNNPGANHVGPPPPAGNNFQNSTVFGLTYQQINGTYCTSLGYQAYACNYMSAGVVGTQKK
jgi:hypothetical protein